MLDSPFVRVAGWLAVLVGVGGFAIYLRKVIRAPSILFRLYEAPFLIAMIYPIGVGFKIVQVGPEFVRFYVADIGFPVFFGLAYGEYIAYQATRDKAGQPVLDRYSKSRITHRAKTRAMVIALAISYGYEILTGYIYRSNPDVSVSLVGNFDWVDMLMYTLGAGSALVIYRLYGATLDLTIADLQKADAQHEAAARQAQKARRKAAATQKRRPYTATNRRGGRK